MSSPKRRWRLSRRGFLIGTGVAGAGLALGYVFGLPAFRKGVAATLEAGTGQPSQIKAEPQVWFEITPEDRVIFYSPKVEMGQGIHTALGQIAADELEIRWEQLEVRQATTSIGPFDPSGTSGSFSVTTLYQPLRETAATMREMLKAEGARLLGVQIGEVAAAQGIVFVIANPTKKLSYGEIVKGVTKWVVPQSKPVLKAASEFRYIGQPIQRVDFHAKLTGKAIYGYDARLPNMLYGAIARPPTIGARLRQAAPGKAAEQPGVVKVVIIDGFAGVVATSRSEAFAGVLALDLDWEQGPLLQQADIEAKITVGHGVGVIIQEQGDADSQLKNAELLSAEFRTPMAAHAHLEPQAALADVGPNGAKIWASTQFPDLVRQSVAKATSLKPEQVDVTPTFLGGGFGRKVGIDVAVEAARLSQAAGKPVHVGWSRTEEFRYGYVRPPTHHQLRAKLENGKIVAFEHRQASGHVAYDFLPTVMMQALGADFGAWRGAMISYNIPHIKTETWHDSLPIPTGWWRGLGLLANTFAVESFIDELAFAAKADPIAFRLAHLPEGERGQRYQQVLKTITEKSGWATPAGFGHARGVACCYDAGTIVAHVAEVGVEGDQIKVYRFWSVVDPGLVINPDGVMAQTQGSIVMGLSSTLIEELVVKDGQVTATNFDAYPLIALKDMPEIEVTVISQGETPHGMGEPAIGPVAAAVGNALFALTGKRLTRLPLRFL